MSSKAKEFAEAMQKRFSKKGGLTVDVSLLSDDDSPCVVSEWVSTGTVVLDTIMGGGLPVGRITEIYGSPSSGKSLIAAQIAAQAQQAGHIVAYIDTENAVSIDMMEKLGVNIDELIYTAPDTVEEVFAFMEEAIETKAKIDPENVLVLIWDSVASTSSIAEMEKEYGKTGYMDHARIISQAMRKIRGRFSKERVAALFLNQTREKIGVMFGDKTATFGGAAISFHASVRIALTLGQKLKIPGKKKAKIVGMTTRAVVIKNKVAMPFKDADLPIYFGRAIDDTQASLLWLIDNGFVTGEAWKTIELEAGAERFQKASWPDFYNEHYEEIANMILSTVEEDDEGYGEPTEDDDEE